MACKMYLIRHGESLGNAERRFLGHTDLGLSELGKKQAECVKRYFDNIELDGIYSSDLIRAQNTVKPLSASKGLNIVLKQNLREIFAGRWENMLYGEIEEKFKADWQAWQKANSEQMGTTDGEKAKALLVRIYSALKEIAEQNEGKTLAVCMHAMGIRVFTNSLYKRCTSELYRTPWVANASVSEVVYENGEFRPEKLNDRSHLGELVTILPPNV